MDRTTVQSKSRFGHGFSNERSVQSYQKDAAAFVELAALSMSWLGL
jgi:hypothetical protein